MIVGITYFQVISIIDVDKHNKLAINSNEHPICIIIFSRKFQARHSSVLDIMQTQKS